MTPWEYSLNVDALSGRWMGSIMRGMARRKSSIWRRVSITIHAESGDVLTDLFLKSLQLRERRDALRFVPLSARVRR
jgi:hypothetical protein